MFKFTIWNDGTISEIMTEPKNESIELSIRNSMDAEDTLSDLRSKGFMVQIEFVSNGRKIYGSYSIT